MEGWSRSVPRGAPATVPDGAPSGPAADSDYYYYYYAPHSINPRMAGASREGGGNGSRTLAVSTSKDEK